MILKVLKPDATIVEILLTPAMRVVHGEFLDCLTDGCVDHFFDHDGFYDGFGMAVPLPSSDVGKIRSES